MRRAAWNIATTPGSGCPKTLLLHWLLPEAKDVQMMLGLSILSHILTATPASPLRKALIDSKLGEDLIGVGFDDGLRQMFYSTGMKGVEPANLDKVQTLNHQNASKVGWGGIDPDMVAAWLNTIEFRLREQNTGYFPRRTFLDVKSHLCGADDGDPLEALALKPPLMLSGKRSPGVVTSKG